MGWLPGKHVDEAFYQRIVKFVNAKYQYNGELEAEDLAQEIWCLLKERAELLEQPAQPGQPRDLWLRLRKSGKLVPYSRKSVRWCMLSVLRNYANRRLSFQRYATARYGSAARNVADDDQGPHEVALVEAAAETAERNERHELAHHALARIESAHPRAVAFARAKHDGVTIEEMRTHPHLGPRVVTAGYRAIKKLQNDPCFAKEHALATA